MSSNRKRSRWGDRDDHNGRNNSSARSMPAVSDQEALDALLTSAKSKEEKYKSRNYNSNNNNRDEHHHHRDDNNRKRHRRDDDSNGFDSHHRGQPSHRRRDNNRHEKPKENGPDYSYYGRNNDDDSRRPSNKRESEDNSQPDPSSSAGAATEEEKEKPNFGLSGALAQEQVGKYKFREPPEARAPNTRWRLYVFKDDKPLETLHISRQSAYLIGRNKELCDILLLHPSLSGQHAVLQYRALPRKQDGQMHVKPYLMDLESTNGSFINGNKLDHARYYELKKGDVLRFGGSTREYVLLTETTTSIE